MISPFGNSASDSPTVPFRLTKPFLAKSPAEAGPQYDRAQAPCFSSAENAAEEPSEDDPKPSGVDLVTSKVRCTSLPATLRTGYRLIVGHYRSPPEGSDDRDHPKIAVRILKRY